MKRVLFLIALAVLTSNICFANVYDLSQISQAKLVTEYNAETTVDQMDTVTFGSYYQSNSDTKDPIEWLVLDRQGDKTLLFSKYILDCKCYNEEYKDVSWENCTLRYLLNNSFYNIAFNNTEKNFIKTINVINSDNTKHNTSGGNYTNDNVFLLSIDEVEKYFYQSRMHSPNKRLATSGTNYAKTVDNFGSNLWVYKSNDYWYNGTSSFWLRSPGISQVDAADVFHYGYLNDSGYLVNDRKTGVRPALWVTNLTN